MITVKAVRVLFWKEIHDIYGSPAGLEVIGFTKVTAGRPGRVVEMDEMDDGG